MKINKNKKLLAAYLSKQGKELPDESAQNNKRGRPIERVNRPERWAAKRTNEGEERYAITLQTEQIQAMKDVAEAQRLSLKECYQAAVNNYLSEFDM